MAENTCVDWCGGTAVSRECGCPEWVERCAHFEGVILVLGRAVGNRIKPCSLAGPSSGLGDNGRFVGEVDADSYSICSCGCGVVGAYANRILFRGDAESALTAFYEAERELLAVNYG